MVAATDRFAAQVAGALRALAVRSPANYTWFGQRIVPTTTSEHGLESSLLDTLYAHFYCHGSAVPAAPPRMAGTALERRRFEGELCAAHRGAGLLVPGWRVAEARADTVIVERGGLLVAVRRSDVEAPDTGAGGGPVAVRTPSWSLSASPGFYTAISRADRMDDHRRTGARVVRICFNLTPRGALVFLGRLSPLLNDGGIPFRIKTPADPRAFDRCDSLVLYTTADHAAAILCALARLHPALEPHLRPGVPAFMRPLSPGIGIAEDPWTESFGRSRCRIVAGAVVEAHRAVARSLRARLAYVAAGFARHGLALERPYRSAALAELDGWTLPLARRRRRGASAGTGDPLGVCRAIGEHLVEQALWSGGGCAWLARSSTTRGSRAVCDRYGLIPAALDAGAAGIALFLAELASVLGDRAMARTAEGAIRYAAAGWHASRPGRLWRGPLGIALAAGRVGAVLGCDAATELALRIRASHGGEGDHGGRLDVVSGLGGIVLGALLLDHLAPGLHPARPALRLGAKLARRTLAAVAPRGRGRAAGRLGLGYGAGAAGIGHVLMELDSIAPHGPYARAARLAFADESRRFDALVRSQSILAADGDEPVRTGSRQVRFDALCSWERGAAGIAMSRARAYALSRDPARRAEAESALRVVCECLRIGVASSVADQAFSPGMLSCAEAVLHARDTQGIAVPGGELPLEVGAAILRIARSRDELRRVLHQAGPGLLSGAAGLGRFLLQLAGAPTPSVLLLTPSWFTQSVVTERPLISKLDVAAHVR